MVGWILNLERKLMITSVCVCVCVCVTVARTHPSFVLALAHHQQHASPAQALPCEVTGNNIKTLLNNNNNMAQPSPCYIEQMEKGKIMAIHIKPKKRRFISEVNSFISKTGSMVKWQKKSGFRVLCGPPNFEILYLSMEGPFFLPFLPFAIFWRETCTPLGQNSQF